MIIKSIVLIKPLKIMYISGQNDEIITLHDDLDKLQKFIKDLLYRFCNKSNPKEVNYIKTQSGEIIIYHEIRKYIFLAYRYIKGYNKLTTSDIYLSCYNRTVEEISKMENNYDFQFLNSWKV